MNRSLTRIDTANLPEFVRYMTNRAIGFDDVYADYLHTLDTQMKGTNYPPYNLVRTGDDTYEVTMAVAGFKKEEIQIEVIDRAITISSVKPMSELPEGVEVIHQGLAMRDFIRTFKLAEYIEVRGATLQDGILTVKLARELPEASKPRLIEIK